MKRNFISMCALYTVLALSLTAASAQILDKIPKFKVGKADKEQPKIKDASTKETTTKDASNRETTTGKTSRVAAELIYKPQRPPAVPMFMRSSVYVQTVIKDEYWKAPGQRNYTSRVPKIRFDQYYSNDKTLNYIVEYFNPDGSPWYSEKLDQGRQSAERTVLFESPSPWGGIIDTKATVATGIFSFKITNQDTQEVLYQGKFKVGKFSRANRPDEKNKFDFFVDHDWLMPFAMIGFHHSLDEVGAMPLEVSVWIKGPVDASDLEGRMFYKGQQIDSTKEDGGASDYDERASGFAVAFGQPCYWKRWQFQWNKIRYDNNGTFNHENFPNAHFVDKNPGDYTVKIYRKGEQIRELNFTVGADGRFAVPAYMSQVFLPYYRVILPIKVLGASEKWNVAAWKTDAFYGNPLNGFSLQ
jgi:hypothetical protein